MTIHTVIAIAPVKGVVTIRTVEVVIATGTTQSINTSITINSFHTVGTYPNCRFGKDSFYFNNGTISKLQLVNQIATIGKSVFDSGSCKNTVLVYRNNKVSGRSAIADICWNNAFSKDNTIKINVTVVVITNDIMATIGNHHVSITARATAQQVIA